MSFFQVARGGLEPKDMYKNLEFTRENNSLNVKSPRSHPK